MWIACAIYFDNMIVYNVQYVKYVQLLCAQSVNSTPFYSYAVYIVYISNRSDHTFHLMINHSQMMHIQM